jgi:predicted RNA-binding Zn ribbon-like protein
MLPTSWLKFLTEPTVLLWQRLMDISRGVPRVSAKEERMSMEHGSGRIQLSAVEEQMVRALAERTHAFFRELNPVQRVMDQAEECWVHEVLPEAAMQGREHALWAITLGIMRQFLSERLAPLDDVEKLQRGLVQEVCARPSVLIEAHAG